ncbi:FadR/GntR family transcriptional regulator [Methylovirgula sp. 4M-Z18]|uniref:FadR/GntR family transcriptional regulator n=1 Tax=Methylovirgula sp. 4M-Z18 TaxID=2293567 RepID=UPI000E2F2AFA|nr:FCD domain-containing protein [Methylovirgula sp. 4M-Z18]RFB80186.1 FadR family transcriptional regulator [Methylovirgula sp. 4M-Z18]
MERRDTQPIAAIGAVKATATHELVAEHIRRAIFLGRFLPGDKLPPERDLAAQLAVSRTTLRVAIRVLEGESILEVKRGATGGLVVLGWSGLSAAEAAAYVGAQRVLIDNIFEYRLANECAATALAAERRSEDDLTHLASVLDEMTAMCATPESRSTLANVARFLACDTDFHLAIARASGNPFLARAVEEARASLLKPIGRVFARLESFVNDWHPEIFDAVRKSDPVAAAAYMKRHIEDTRDAMLAILPRS